MNSQTLTLVKQAHQPQPTWIDTQWTHFLASAKRITPAQQQVMEKALSREELEHYKTYYKHTTLDEFYHFELSYLLKTHSYIAGKYKSELLRQMVQHYKRVANHTHNTHNTPTTKQTIHPLHQLQILFPDSNKIQQATTLQTCIHHLTNRELFHIMYKLPYLNLVAFDRTNGMYPLERILQSTPHYELGIQEKETYEMMYIKFYDWAVFDYDMKCTFDDISGMLHHVVTRVPNVAFVVYQTTNGFHVHVMNELIQYKDPRYTRLASMMQSDSWYTRFVSSNGYKLRLTPKPLQAQTQDASDTSHTPTISVASYCGLIQGHASTLHPQCLVYQSIYESKMNAVNTVNAPMECS